MDKLQFLVLITFMSSCERRLVSVKKLGSRVRVGSVRVRIGSSCQKPRIGHFDFQYFERPDSGR